MYLQVQVGKQIKCNRNCNHLQFFPFSSQARGLHWWGSHKSNNHGHRWHHIWYLHYPALCCCIHLGPLWQSRRGYCYKQSTYGSKTVERVSNLGCTNIGIGSTGKCKDRKSKQDNKNHQDCNLSAASRSNILSKIMKQLYTLFNSGLPCWNKVHGSDGGIQKDPNFLTWSTLAFFPLHHPYLWVTPCLPWPCLWWCHNQIHCFSCSLTALEKIKLCLTAWLYPWVFVCFSQVKRQSLMHNLHKTTLQAWASNF